MENNQEHKTDFIDKTILLVDLGPLKKKFILQKIKKTGTKIIALDKIKEWAKPYVDHWIIADTYNHREAILKIQDFLKDNPTIKIDGAITFWEDSVLLTSKIIDKLNLTGIPFEVARKARNKYLFREFCHNNNIRAPKHKLISTKEDLEWVCQNFAFPLVVKPAFGADSAFVIRADNKEEILETYSFVKQSMSADTEETSSFADGMDIFVEEYIDGDEVDIDILLQNGKIKFYSIADNYNKTRDRFFLDNGQAIPSGLPEKEQEDLLQLAEETLEKMGVQNGCIHFEAKSTKTGPVPIEVNLRMGGDYVYSYIKSAWGVDLIENALKIASGQYIKINKPEEPLKYIVGWDPHPETSGVLVELEIDEQLKRKKYLEEIHLYKEIGDAIMLPPDGYESLGWLTVSGDNVLDAQDNLKEALNFLKFKVVKFDSESSVGKTLRKNRFSAAVLNKNLLLGAAKIEKVKIAFNKGLKNLHIGVVGNALFEIGNNGQMPIGRAIVKTLRERGYNKVSFFDLNNLNKAFNELKKSEVDLVINICEKVNNSNQLKYEAAAILESLQIPYTGSSTLTIALCQDKIKTKKMLAFHGIPTPAWDYVYDLDEKINENLKYPLIVKPSNTDNAFGISNDSVVKNPDELKIQLKKIIVDYGMPALIEEYIDGDEYDVSILGEDEDNFRVLPLSRSIFKNLPKDYWHIYTEEAKNTDNHPAYNKITVQRPLKNISKKLEALITEIALDTYSILDCRDYGRVEIKVDEDDNPYVLELNPNPSLNIDESLCEAAKLTGMDFGDLLEEIIALAIERYKKNKGIYRFI